jgi:hypothetical protein
MRHVADRARGGLVRQRHGPWERRVQLFVRRLVFILVGFVELVLEPVLVFFFELVVIEPALLFVEQLELRPIEFELRSIELVVQFPGIELVELRPFQLVVVFKSGCGEAERRRRAATRPARVNQSQRGFRSAGLEGAAPSCRGRGRRALRPASRRSGSRSSPASAPGTCRRTDTDRRRWAP